MVDLNPLTLLSLVLSLHHKNKVMISRRVPWMYPDSGSLCLLIALSFHPPYHIHLIFAPRPTYSIFVNSISQVCNHACRVVDTGDCCSIDCSNNEECNMSSDVNLYLAIQQPQCQYCVVTCHTALLKSMMKKRYFHPFFLSASFCNLNFWSICFVCIFCFPKQGE